MTFCLAPEDAVMTMSFKESEMRSIASNRVCHLPVLGLYGSTRTIRRFDQKYPQLLIIR